jgi:hypothetical protein
MKGLNEMSLEQLLSNLGIVSQTVNISLVDIIDLGGVNEKIDVKKNWKQLYDGFNENEVNIEKLYFMIDHIPSVNLSNKINRTWFTFICPEIGWKWQVNFKDFDWSSGSVVFHGLVEGYETEYGPFTLDDIWKLVKKKELSLYIQLA